MPFKKVLPRNTIEVFCSKYQVEVIYNHVFYNKVRHHSESSVYFNQSESYIKLQLSSHEFLWDRVMKRTLAE